VASRQTPQAATSGRRGGFTSPGSAFTSQVDCFRIRPENVSENPYVVETELVSPFATLAPGEHHDFEYEWRATNIGGNFPILECSDVGCTSELFSVVRVAPERVRFSGRFGVFNNGEVQLNFLGPDGKAIGEALRQGTSPNSPVVVASMFRSARMPSGARTAMLTIFDSSGRPLADLARAEVRDE